MTKHTDDAAAALTAAALALEQCQAERRRLQNAIRLHRDTRGQYDGVSERDRRLYLMLPETPTRA
jgi:hypothetical protein